MTERKGRRRLGPSPYRRPRVQWGSEYCQHLSVQKPRARESGREGEIQTRGGSANLGRSSEAPENIGHWPIFFIEEKRRFAVCKNSAVDSNILIWVFFLTTHQFNFKFLKPLCSLSFDASSPSTLRLFLNSVPLSYLRDHLWHFQINTLVSCAPLINRELSTS